MAHLTERRIKRISEMAQATEPAVSQSNIGTTTNNNTVNTSQMQMIERLWAEMPTKKRVIAKRGDTVLYGDYVELPQVLRRLQEVFGLNYSLWFASPIFYENTVVIRAVIEADKTQVEGFGTATIRNGDVETAVKSAETDAVKRACRYLGIGAFLYEKGLTETNGSGAQAVQGTQSAPAKGNRNGKAKPAPATTDEMPNLPTDLRNAVLRAFRRGLEDDEIGIEEGYALLRKHASAKQANSIIRYPDLVEEFCDRLFVLEDNSEIREMVSELVNRAIQRFKDREDWRDYYDAEEDDDYYEEVDDDDPFA
jgi:hypothetical protein